MSDVTLTRTNREDRPTASHAVSKYVIVVCGSMEAAPECVCILIPRNMSEYIVSSVPSPVEHQICPAVCVLMKLSFDEEHRHAMNELGQCDIIALSEVIALLLPGIHTLRVCVCVGVICPCRWSAGGG